MNWYKVTFDAQGKLVSCLKLEPSRVNSEGVPGIVYIQARTSKEATIGAIRLQERLKTRARRARYKEEGKCHCGSKLEEGDGRVCKRCIRLQKEALERKLAKALGLPVEEKTLRETQEEGRQEKLTNIERQVLLEVKQAWKRTKTVTGFSVWLKKRLEQAGVSAEEAKVGVLNLAS